jgi:uncharacterized protein (UPF0333 family)
MKGQTAIEYLLLFSLMLIALSFLTYYAQDMTQRNREEIIMSNAVIAVNKIVEAADIVYTQGKPSQITLSIYIPENVHLIEFSNKMIIMRIDVSSGSTDIIAESKAILKNSTGGIYFPSTGGTKRIKVKAEGSYVNVTES